MISLTPDVGENFLSVKHMPIWYVQARIFRNLANEHNLWNRSLLYRQECFTGN